MSLEDQQLEQPLDEGNVESSYHPELSDDELLAQEADGSLYANQEEQPVDDPADDVPPEVVPEEVAEPEEVEPTEQTPAVNVDVEPTDEVVPTDAVPAEATVQTPAAPKAEVQPQVQADAPTVDHAAFYAQITKPFKANGRDIQVTDVQDVIALMQQGANYDKKMAALKPALQIQRTLDKAGLLDPEKIGFAIDLYNGKPEAIAKLAKDKGIDLFNIQEDEGYVPQPQMATEQEVELSQIFTDLNANPTFQETFNTLEGWDGKSQQELLANPNMLRMFQEHKDAGVFDNIHNVIERERMFGRLVGVSDLDAYRLVGDRLYGGQAQGQAQAQPLAQRPVAPVAQAPVVATPTPIPDPRITAQKQAVVAQKRNAAASPRKVAPAKAVADFNPLTASDDEIDAMIARSSRLM